MAELASIAPSSDQKCGDSDDHHGGSSSLSDEEELRLEKEHFEKVVNAILYYR